MAKVFKTKTEITKVELELRRRRIERELNKKHFDLFDLTQQTHSNYQVGWFNKLLCETLEKFIKDIENKKSPRLIINCPPRSGKSVIVSEKLPVRILSSHPGWNIIVASHTSSLAEKFSRRARDTVRDDFIRENAPQLRLSKDRTGVEEWETSLRGGYKAVGILGSITGSGSHCMIIDDPVKDYEEAYSKTIRDKIYETYRSVIETRLSPGGGILLTQTRWHEDDLTGRLLREEPENWQVFSYPAIAEEDEEFRKKGEALHPERYSVEFFEKLKVRGGWTWNALYQQRPVSAEGAMLKRHWWKFYDYLTDDFIDSFDERIQSWDLTFKDSKNSDYVVGQAWGRKAENAYLLDQVRAQMNFPDTLQAIISFSAKNPKSKTILIEEKANGAAIISVIKSKLPNHSIIAINPDSSKEARVAGVSPKVESGNVFLPKYASFTNDFIDECASFPKSANDDQVDAMSQSLSRLFINKINFFGLSDNDSDEYD